MSKTGSVYIVILNWNGWKDTVECLESVFRNNCSNYRVVVCDNGSSDRSYEMIKTWAEGAAVVDSIAYSQLQFLTNPPVTKPISYQCYAKQQIEQNSGDLCTDDHLILIQNGDNLGFAGGNNVGIEYSLKCGASYIWLLNNDTVVDPMAVVRMIDACESDADIGIVGSKILLYGKPELIWCIGAELNWHTGYPNLLGCLHPDDGTYDVMREIDSISGCSMLIKRKVLENIGMMDERFFLYFEETDWIETAKRQGYKVLYHPGSKVFHKVSASIGGTDSPQMKYYMTRNSFLFMRKNTSLFEFAKYIFRMLVWFYPTQIKKGIQAGTLKMKDMKAICFGLFHSLCGRYGRYHI